MLKASEGKTFAIHQKSVKTMKLFSGVAFVVYGIYSFITLKFYALKVSGFPHMCNALELLYHYKYVCIYKMKKLTKLNVSEKFQF